MPCQPLQRKGSLYHYRHVNLTISLGFLFTCLFLFPGSAWAETAVVRVLLAEGVNRVGFAVAAGKYVLKDASTGLPIGNPAVGEVWSVTREGPVLKVSKGGSLLPTPFKGPISLTQVDASTPALFNFKNVRYRGNLTITNESEGLLAVNVVNIEHYLYGVVSKEMGTGAHVEALKAQAVVSRSYALSSLGNSTRYDVGTNIMTQVYKGYEAEAVKGGEPAIKAVDATAGQAIYYDNLIVKAFFSSNSGGYTENSENVWSAPVVYLRAVPSPWDDWAARYPNQNNGWPAYTYQWSKTISKAQLTDLINQWNKEQTAQNRPDNLIEIGQIAGVQATYLQRDGIQPTASGRATQLDLIGTKGVKSFFKDTIRSVLDLRSTLFQMETDAQVTVLGAGSKIRLNSGGGLVAAGLASTTVPGGGSTGSYTAAGAGGTKTFSKVFNSIQINGKGYGHGVGMSQWGAWGMAENGYSYQQIIEYYYNQDKKDGRLVIRQYSR